MLAVVAGAAAWSAFRQSAGWGAVAATLGRLCWVVPVVLAIASSVLCGFWSSSGSCGSVVRGFILSSPSGKVCSLSVGFPSQPRMLLKGGRQVAVAAICPASWSGTRYTCSKNSWLSMRRMWVGAWW